MFIQVFVYFLSFFPFMATPNGRQDLRFSPVANTTRFCIGRWSLNQWTSREVPTFWLLKHLFQHEHTGSDAGFPTWAVIHLEITLGAMIRAPNSRGVWPSERDLSTGDCYQGWVLVSRRSEGRRTGAPDGRGPAHPCVGLNSASAHWAWKMWGGFRENGQGTTGEGPSPRT